MRNIRELSIGSIVWVSKPDASELVCEVCGIKDNIINVKILHSSIGEEEIIGCEHKYPVGRINGLIVMDHVLRKLGFIESDERSWKLMYYFGDMRLYWKRDLKRKYSVFKFKPDFTQKRWIRIECLYIHSLQNIMRFLTGGELEFEYKTISNGKEQR